MSFDERQAIQNRPLLLKSLAVLALVIAGFLLQDTGCSGTPLMYAFRERENILDLGDITNSRGTEAFLLLWIRMFGAFQTPMFQFSIVR